MTILFENNWVRIEPESAEIPWLKIFTRCGSREFSQCDAETRAEIWRLLHIIECEMIAFYQPKKVNIASFANYVPKVHWHIMARFEQDSFFPEPMWGEKQREGAVDVAPVEAFFASIKHLIEES